MRTHRVPARVVVADPPWLFGDKIQGRGRGAEKHYKVMSVADICAMQLPAIANDAVLLLWRVASQPEEAMRVVRAWGFEPKTEIVWVKLPRSSAPVPSRTSTGEPRLHFGMGRYTRASHETCILATRGKAISLVKNRSTRSVFFAPVGAHSEKPQAFFDLVEGLFPGPRVELFARRTRPGWRQYGDELGKLDP